MVEEAFDYCDDDVHSAVARPGLSQFVNFILCITRLALCIWDFSKDLDQAAKKIEAYQNESEQLTKMTLDNLAPGPNSSAALKQKLEADSKSIFINQVEYSSSAKQLEEHFNGCGAINRVTILKNNFGAPKGCAYIEFEDSESVPLAMSLDNSLFNGRTIQVFPKRTNRPGLKRPSRGRAMKHSHIYSFGRGRGRGRGRGYRAY